MSSFSQKESLGEPLDIEYLAQEQQDVDSSENQDPAQRPLTLRLKQRSSEQQADPSRQQAPVHRVPAQQATKLPDDKDHISGLPAEMLGMIMECLVEPGDRRFTDKADLMSIRQMNRTLRDAAAKPFFRNITIKLTLQDNIPQLEEDWVPQKWETPMVMQDLEASDALRTLVQSVRVRLHPFCERLWTEDEFRNIARRLGIHRDASIREMIEPAPSQGVPRDVQSRRDLIILQYDLMYRHLSMSRRMRPHRFSDWVQDASELLAPLLEQLPNLRYIEAAPMSPQTGLQNTHYVEGYRDTDRVVIRAAPRTVASVMIRNFLSDVDMTPVNRSWFPPPQQHPPAPSVEPLNTRANHLTALTLLRPHRHAGFEMHQLRFWQLGLPQLHALRTLTLAQDFSDILSADVRWRSMIQMLDLNILFDSVQLPSVTNLVLDSWVLSRSFFERRLDPSKHGSTFPNVQHLTLRDVSMGAETLGKGGKDWVAILTMLLKRQGNGVKINVPSVAVVLAGEFIVVKVKWRTKAILEEMLEKARGKSALEGEV